MYATNCWRDEQIGYPGLASRKTDANLGHPGRGRDTRTTPGGDAGATKVREILKSFASPRCSRGPVRSGESLPGLARASQQALRHHGWHGPRWRNSSDMI